MDLWSRWLDQPVESDAHHVDAGGSSLVGEDKSKDPTRSTTVAAVSSDDGGDDQRQDETQHDLDLPDENDETAIPVIPGDSSAPAESSTLSISPTMALELSSPNLPSSSRRTLRREAQDAGPISTKTAPPEEGAGNQKENVCSQPTLPDPRLHQMNDTPPFRCRPASMSRPNRPSPLSSSSTQNMTSGKRPKFSPMATPSRRISQQYASRRSSCLSGATPKTGHVDDMGFWKVWEDQLDSNGSQDSENGGRSADEEVRPELLYPCPFRRRNPSRFNVRDHTHCAKTLFGSTQELRLHITSYHRRQRILHQCRRCKMGFESESALDQHMMLPKDQICESISAEAFVDPEDGITDCMDRDLVLERADVESWQGIWRLVFPGDKDIPAPDFHPIVELVEVEQRFNEGQDVLKASLQETLRLFLPPNIDGDFCRFVAGQLELTFETHRANTMRNCLNQFSSPATHTHLPLTEQPSGSAELTTSRAKRSSRRSTLLYSTSLPNTPRFPAHPTPNVEQVSPPLNPTLGTHQIQRSHSTRSSNRASRLFLTLPPHTIRPLTLSDSSSPQTPATRSIGDNQSDYDCSRDSRDSGIEIPCEVCEMESCQCREIILSLSGAKHSVAKAKAHNDPDPKAQTDSTDERYSTLQTRGHGPRKLRHQPNLRVKTTGRGIVSAPTTGNLSFPIVERPFSPQSFKQRVMRKQESKGVLDDTADH